jgi:hypothetical protein
MVFIFKIECIICIVRMATLHHHVASGVAGHHTTTGVGHHTTTGVGHHDSHHFTSQLLHRAEHVLSHFEHGITHSGFSADAHAHINSHGGQVSGQISWHWG